ncbi:hypothetical protein MPSEU_000765400 [Mayamaea pseudoterrestris]|nr:hypothetical protein MPSEU_000765400 [Mayamaea pseudoterrestris]
MDMDENGSGNRFASASDQTDPAEPMHVPPIAPHAPLIAPNNLKEIKTKRSGSTNMEGVNVKEACAGMLVSRALYLLVQSDMFHKIRNGASFTSINCTRIVADNHSLYRKAVIAGYALLKESDRRELISGAWSGDEAKAMTVFSEIDELIKEMTARMQQKEKVNGQRQPFVISVAKIITRYEGVQAKKFAITKDALDLWKLERFLPYPKSAFLSKGQQSLRDWISNGQMLSNALQSKGGIVDCQIVEGRKLKGQQDDSIEVLEESMALISIGKVNDGKIIEGHLTYNNGSSYTGSFLNGLMHGPGRLVFSNGSVYQGEFQNNFFHGNGKTFMSHGDWYEGTWKNDEWVIGRGRCVVATDTVVEGEFKSGIFHGYGGVALCEGNWLKGTWENNKWVTGEGRLVNFDGTVFEGTFENGIFRGRISWSIGNWYKGSWENTLNVRSHGRIVSSDDIVFEGRFENGVFQGEVSCSNANWYKGPWADALIEETYGQYASADGSVYQGKLKDGHCHGYDTRANFRQASSTATAN